MADTTSEFSRDSSRDISTSTETSEVTGTPDIQDSPEAPDTPDTPDAVNRAIAAARAAAHAAGLDTEDDEDTENAADTADTAGAGFAGVAAGFRGARPGTTRRAGAQLTSFTFHFDGLASAVRAGEIEAALNTLPGVQARVVYSTAMAWVTAPESLNPDILRGVFAEYGVESWLTAASLRRRSERLTAPGRRHISENRRRREERLRKRREDVNPGVGNSSGAPGAPGTAAGKRGAWLSGGQDNTEVLHTARALITGARLLVAAVLGIPVVVLQIATPWQFDYWQWLCLALALPVVTWCAWPFHRAMIAGLRRGMPALDAASSAAIILAYLYSAYVLITGPAGDPGWRSGNILIAWGYHGDALFLDVACGCTLLLLFGRLASRRSRLRSMLALNMVLPSGATTEEKVTVVRRDRQGRPAKFTISPAEIRVGDDVLVAGGESVPADGEVIGGRAALDNGPFGGVASDGQVEGAVSVGSRVFAGARHLGDATSEPLKVRVSRTGSRTRIAAVRRWIAAAEQDENQLDQLATRTASLLVPWGVVIAVIAGLGWFAVRDSTDAAVATALTVLVAVAPVALAVSTTLSLRIGLARAAAGGTLLRNADTIHHLAAIDAIIFNRAGTLSTGPMSVIGVTAATGENPEMVLRVAGALSLESPHRVCRAIVRADRESRDSGSGGAEVPHWLEAGQVEVDDHGVFSATIDLPDRDGKPVRQVMASLWRPRDLSELTNPVLVNAALSGGAPLVVSWKGEPRGVINLADTVAPDASGAVDALEAAGVETFMMSRDTYRVARRMADSVGISTVLAGISPNRKAATVRRVHSNGATVAMVGDRDVLDCLAVADVGILMGAADHLDPPAVGRTAHAAAGTGDADIVLVREDVSAIPEALNLARHVRSTVNGNLLFAWGYNIAAVVLAVAGVLNPLVGTALMLGSSLLVEWRSARIGHRDYTATGGMAGRPRYAGVSTHKRT
ncbi:MAG TPA: HAD family hydrolase [Candidatus Corynebacterium avicola]|uniref:HAD family hydrolase n=1 Tax=Candidatus Corynebacterium avicola TaxID=2838527 RepID=A0A9D1RN13_9CORY|nr:HAD family hydrolase [Candidatus Corynebacterium avicola]